MFCRDGFEEEFWQIHWKGITITFMLKSGLSVANKQYYRLLLRSSEGIYTSLFNTEKHI